MAEVPAKGNVLGKLVPARYILAILGSISMAIIYGLKVNLSFAMVGMLNHTAIPKAENHGQGGDECPADDDGPEDQSSSDGPFAWPPHVQGILLSCYFWGYFIAQMPGARIAELFSAKWVMFFSVAVNVVCTLLTPVCAYAHYGYVIFMRVLEGIGGGVSFPAMHVLLSKWAPPNERSVLAALVYAGTSLGTVISMLLAGVITEKLGWENVFYIMGGLSAILCILWAILIQDSPSQQRFISKEERQMIMNSLGESQEGKVKLPVPWRAVFTSPAFLAILVAHTCSNWGWYMLLIELPFYMQSVLKFKITQNALATAIPFLTLWLFSMSLSKALDHLKANGKITTTAARKISTLLASVIPGICMLGLTFVGCNRGAAVGLTGTGVTFMGAMFCGFLANHIDIAPNFAGTLMAITNTVATIPGILVPMAIGALSQSHSSAAAWRIMFIITIILFAIEAVIYALFGSGEEQPWNKSKPRNVEEISITERASSDK